MSERTSYTKYSARGLMIPYSRQTVRQDDIDAVVRVLRSDWLTQGPLVPEFERALAAAVGAKYAVVFSSGTGALEAAYHAADIGRGDEVITSPLTFAATANAALLRGAKVVFADIEEETGNMDPREVEKKITKKTKAIIPIDYGGLPAGLDALKRIAKKHNLVLIEDAAHALGAVYKGKRVGAIADMTMFSFHPVKSITTGEGGAITTNRKDFYDALVLFRSHGITREFGKLKTKQKDGWYYEMQELSSNYRITELQAALGLSQLKKLARFVNARRRIAAQYQKSFAGDPRFILPREYPGARSAWHLYPLRLRGAYAAKRDYIFAKLRKSGIGVQVHYIPVYWHPYYQKLGYKNGLCPKAEEFFRSEISIPVFPRLTHREQAYVIDCIKKAVRI